MLAQNENQSKKSKRLSPIKKKELRAELDANKRIKKIKERFSPKKLNELEQTQSQTSETLCQDLMRPKSNLNLFYQKLDFAASLEELGREKRHLAQRSPLLKSPKENLELLLRLTSRTLRNQLGQS